MSSNHQGTPAMLALNEAGVPFEVATYEHDPDVANFGQEAADALGMSPETVFKTLVVQTDLDQDHGLVVAVLPVAHQLSLKRAAVAVGAKKARMADPADVERVTGYVVGGVSPLGQKRALRTVIDESAEALDRMAVSGGRRGVDLLLDPAALARVAHATFHPLT